MKIISYNLRKNAAIAELTELAKLHRPDFLCLQECDSDLLLPEVGELRLAGATHTNRLGLAIYYNQAAFELDRTREFTVRKSFHDRVLTPAHERLLAARLRSTADGEMLLVGSFHAAPLTASNMLRRKQIAGAHRGLKALGPKLPSIMVGDFNYPWFIRGLERRLAARGYDLTRPASPTYKRYRVFTGYFDFVTSSGFQVDAVNTLPAGASDHRPIHLKASTNSFAATKLQFA